MAAVVDIRLMLATSGDVFSAGAVSSPCFFTTYDDVVTTDNFGGAQQTVRRSDATVATADFPDLKEDDAVTVNGTAYKVLDTRLIQDGQMTLINLQKAVQ